MKKLFTVMLIAIIAVSSAFAVTGHVDVSSGYTFNMNLESKEPTAYYYSTVPVMIDGVTYFGDHFGLAYGAELFDINMGATANGTTIKPEKQEAKFTAYPYAGIALKYDFSDNFGLGANVAATYKWHTESEEILGNTVKMSSHMLGMMGDLFFNIHMSSINFRLGCKASGDLALWVSAEKTTTNLSEHLPSMVRVLPYVGVGFAY